MKGLVSRISLNLRSNSISSFLIVTRFFTFRTMASNDDSLAAAAISHEAAAGLAIEAKASLIDAMFVSTSLESQCTSAESDSFKSPPSQEG